MSYSIRYDLKTTHIEEAFLQLNKNDVAIGAQIFPSGSNLLGHLGATFTTLPPRVLEMPSAKAGCPSRNKRFPAGSGRPNRLSSIVMMRLWDLPTRFCVGVAVGLARRSMGPW